MTLVIAVLQYMGLGVALSALEPVKAIQEIS